MKAVAAAALALLGSASAFVAPSAFNGARVAARAAAPASGMKMAAIDNLIGRPFGPDSAVFDPLGLANDLNEKELAKYREAELKHGRVAMMAIVGFLVAEAFRKSSF